MRAAGAAFLLVALAAIAGAQQAAEEPSRVVGAPRGPKLEGAALEARAHEVADAPVANLTVVDGRWRRIDALNPNLEDRRVWIEIPTGFTEMQQQAPERALEWRLVLRQLFERYFSRGYRAVDFVLQREHGFGRYLLAR